MTKLSPENVGENWVPVGQYGSQNHGAPLYVQLLREGGQVDPVPYSPALKLNGLGLIKVHFAPVI